MNNPPVLGAHLVDGCGTSGFFSLIRHFICQVFKVGFTGFHVPFDIHLYPYPGFTFSIDNFVGQKLHGIQGLALSADQDTGISAFYAQGQPVSFGFGAYPGMGDGYYRRLVIFPKKKNSFRGKRRTKK